MKKNQLISFVAIMLFLVIFISCKKDGLGSTTAKKIQYRWERFSTASATDYLDGRAIIWTVSPSSGTYMEFGSDGYFTSDYGFASFKYQYKVDEDKILSLIASPTGATTPQYTDTAFIRHVDDHLLVLFRRHYFLSQAYNYMDESIDSLKR